MYSVLIIAGPSASGKTTVAEELLKKEKNRFELVRSLTTRAKRGDGFDDEYLYATREEFEFALKNDGVLEHTEYAGELYGTPRSEIERISAEGKMPLLILDLNGVRALSERVDILNPCSVYIYCSFGVLEKRLNERYLNCGNDEECKLRFTKRMLQNQNDLENILENEKMFYALLENCGNISETVSALLSKLDSFLSGVPRDTEEIRKTADSIKASVLFSPKRGAL